MAKCVQRKDIPHWPIEKVLLSMLSHCNIYFHVLKVGVKNYVKNVSHIA
jgi:hypothetical protein